MTVSQKIKMALSYVGISESELARRLDTSPQALHQRMKTGRFTSEELDDIAKAMGASYRFGFVFADGTEV